MNTAYGMERLMYQRETKLFEDAKKMEQMILDWQYRRLFCPEGCMKVQGEEEA